MHTTHVFIDSKGRTVISIPSFLRDTLDLVNKQEVEIQTDGERIIIIPIKG